MVTMRSRSIRALQWLALVIVAGACAQGFARSEPPPAKDATAYPAVDVHPQEHVAIAAEPWDSKEKCKIFQIDYLKYGFMPIRLIVTNQGDRPISLDQARIYIVDAQGQRINAAEPEDVDRRMKPPDNRSTLGIPVGPIRIHRKPKNWDSKVKADFDQYEYSSLGVEPHTTHAGFLFYDVQGLGSDPLRGAKLVLTELKDAQGQQLFYFEIPFDLYLKGR